MCSEIHIPKRKNGFIFLIPYSNLGKSFSFSAIVASVSVRKACVCVCISFQFRFCGIFQWFWSNEGTDEPILEQGIQISLRANCVSVYEDWRLLLWYDFRIQIYFIIQFLRFSFRIQFILSMDFGFMLFRPLCPCKLCKYFK